MKQRLSLRGRGLQLLAQREHSVVELRRKLLHHARTEHNEARDRSAVAVGDPVSAALPPSVDEHQQSSPAEQVEAVLEWLRSHRYLSEERFVESRVHARADRFGNLRIRQELAQHGVVLSSETAQSLKETEAERAKAVWARKFGHLPADVAERGRQVRFLASRGFSSEAIRRVIEAGSDD